MVQITFSGDTERPYEVRGDTFVGAGQTMTSTMTMEGKELTNPARLSYGSEPCLR